MNHGDIWLGPESALAAYLAQLEAFNAGIAAGTIQMRSNYEDDDELPNPVGYDNIGNLAVISVKGAMITSSSFFSRLFGVTSYVDIKERFIQASEDYKAKGVILNIDSPGGSERGTKATADFVRSFNNGVKPVVTYTENQMASAGYWIGAGGSKIAAHSDAMVGSIGVLMTHFEYTERLKQNGIKVTTFRSAPYKALGGPYEKLSDKAHEVIEERMTQLHNKFVDGITLLRGMDRDHVAQKVANGKVYTAEESLKLGIVDNLMSFEELVAKLDAAFNKGPAAARP